MADNPHPYDDGAWLQACDNAESVLFQMWEAGGSKEDILQEIAQRLENLDD